MSLTSADSVLRSHPVLLTSHVYSPASPRVIFLISRLLSAVWFEEGRGERPAEKREFIDLVSVITCPLGRGPIHRASKLLMSALVTMQVRMTSSLSRALMGDSSAVIWNRKPVA